jgi:hypothetical protein
VSHTKSKRQENRHSNSFTDGAVLSVVALNRALMLDRNYLAYMRNPGWQEMVRKCQHAKDKIEELALRKEEQQERQAAE